MRRAFILRTSGDIVFHSNGTVTKTAVLCFANIKCCPGPVIVRSGWASGASVSSSKTMVHRVRLVVLVSLRHVPLLSQGFRPCSLTIVAFVHFNSTSHSSHQTKKQDNADDRVSRSCMPSVPPTILPVNKAQHSLLTGSALSHPGDNCSPHICSITFCQLQISLFSLSYRKCSIDRQHVVWIFTSLSPRST